MIPPGRDIFSPAERVAIARAVLDRFRASGPQGWTQAHFARRKSGDDPASDPGGDVWAGLRGLVGPVLGPSADPLADNADAFGLCGAILRETRRATRHRSDLDDAGLRHAENEMLALFCVHGLLLPPPDERAALRAIVGFNDYPGRTFADVIDLCERVASALDAGAGRKGAA